MKKKILPLFFFASGLISCEKPPFDEFLRVETPPLDFELTEIGEARYDFRTNCYTVEVEVLINEPGVSQIIQCGLECSTDSLFSESSERVTLNCDSIPGRNTGYLSRIKPGVTYFCRPFVSTELQQTKYGESIAYTLTDAWIRIEVDKDFIPRHGATSFTINNKAYLGLGASEGNILLKDFWSYSESEGWERLEDFPGLGRKNAYGYSPTDIDSGYILGGKTEVSSSQPSTEFWIYSLEGIWENLQPFPEELPHYSTISATESSAYLIGGVKNSIFSPLPNKNIYQMFGNEWNKIDQYKTQSEGTDLVGFYYNFCDENSLCAQRCAPYKFQTIFIGSGFRIPTAPLSTTPNSLKTDFWQLNLNFQESQVFPINCFRTIPDTRWEDLEPNGLPNLQVNSLYLEPRSKLYSFQIGTKGFLLIPEKKSVWEFDLIERQWSKKKNLPDDISLGFDGISFSLNGNGFIGTGNYQDSLSRQIYKYFPD